MLDKLIPWWVYAAVGVALVGVGWVINGWRLNHTIDTMKLENAESVRTFQAAARKKESDWNAQLLEAYNAKSKRENELSRAVAVARNDRDSLQRKLTEVRGELPGSSIATCRERADTITNILGQCVTRYQELGSVTDRHVNDKQTLMDAWPSKLKDK